MATVTGLTEWEARLRALPAAVQAETVAELQSWVGDVTGTMATNAPWTDRTGDARRNLHAWVVSVAQGAILYVGHGVPYGVNLELGHQGRFAVLWPTLRQVKAPILASLRARLARRFGGQWTAAA